MMKRINKLSLAVAVVLATMSTSSCSDQFLEDKKNYDSTDTNAYNYMSGALARLADVYKVCLPDANSTPSSMFNSTGLNDDHSKSTEEYSGFSIFVDPEKPLTSQANNNTVPDYFQGTKGNPITSAYGRIRNINDVIAGVSGSTLTEDEKAQILGQTYFFRAWCYYNLVKWYGGVPIIKEVQPPLAESITPRSSAKDCFQFIFDDLNKSAELLAPFTENGGWTDPSTNYGRVTSGTALALLGRVKVLYASPLFNRKNDKDRYRDAYQTIEASLPRLAACGYGLANENDPGKNAGNWAKMFSSVPSEEAVFVTLYNTIVKNMTPDYQKNNRWEQSIRPKNTLGSGGKTPSAMLVDMFPMKDGKLPLSCDAYNSLEKSTLAYDPELPFVDRDPRFYRTFAFPGVRWTFNGTPANDKNNYVQEGSSYVLWNYVWYSSTEMRDKEDADSKSIYGADGLLNDVAGFYVRKRTDDRDINGTPRYEYSDGFERSASPYMEIRFAEVLLNYAEAACGAGHLDVAVAQLQRIRARVGYTGDYGLPSDLAGDAGKCMAAILYERQIELAYEGKRFDDLRRWMLFDGGKVAVSGAPATWTLGGDWAAGTDAYLGFKKLNGQRRDNLEFRVKVDGGLGGEGIGKTSYNKTKPADSDPLLAKLGLTNYTTLSAKGLNLTQDFSNNSKSHMDDLIEFYKENLKRKTRKGDAYDVNQGKEYISFLPYYYFLGLQQGIQGSNATLLQTIGWGDYNNGGANGTFDPLAE